MNNPRIKYSRFSIAGLLVPVLVWLIFSGAGSAMARDTGSGYLPWTQREAPRGTLKSQSRDGLSWTVRVMTPRELERIGERDWDLSPSVAKRLLARLNVRDFDYIDQDIRGGRPIKVPHDFTALKNWTPLRRFIPEAAGIPKLILLAKDVGFIGWYERGRLVGDSYVCIGRQNDWTAAGVYPIREKDIDHVSRSYPNAYGDPAPMPWAMRIYELVWIHAGDITGPHCSRGCINLPVPSAVELFEWAPVGTPVMIVEKLSEAPSVIATNRSNCTLFASSCTAPASTGKRS